MKSRMRRRTSATRIDSLAISVSFSLRAPMVSCPFFSRRRLPLA